MPLERLRPDVIRIHENVVNTYLIAGEDGLTLVDAGIAAHWPLLLQAIEALGRRVEDLHAVILTHAHIDHVGMAERARTEAGAEVQIHEADLDYILEGRTPPQPNPAALLRGWAGIRMFLYFLRHGVVAMPKIGAASAFADGAILPVPGRPRAIHAPGHTPGLAAVHFEDRGILCTGDALVTVDPARGRPGPQLMPAGANTDHAQALASLARLEPLAAELILPGHGLPWRGEPGSAVAAAREAAERGRGRA